MRKIDEIIALLEKCLNTQLAKEDTGNMAAYMDMVATRHELVHQALTKLRAKLKEKPKDKLHKAVKKIMVGFNPPEFDINEKTPIGSLDLSDPETAYLIGWERAILECGEILAKALQPPPCKTCGGSEEVEEFSLREKRSLGTIPCPDCQKGEITDGYLNRNKRV